MNDTENKHEEFRQLSGLRFPLKLWELIYPFGVYYSAIIIFMIMLQMILGKETASYMLRQIIASLLVLPVVFSFYRTDQLRFSRVGFCEYLSDARNLCRAVLLTVAAILPLSVALNNLIAMSPLVTLSEGYGTASNNFYGSTLFLELLGSALITPVLEELIYRGVIFGRMRQMLSRGWSIGLSAVFFGLIHFNLVQFVYASLLGLALALLMERAGHVYLSIVAHIAANLFAVLRTELGLLSNMADGSVPAWTCSIFLLLAGMAILGFICFKNVLCLQK